MERKEISKKTLTGVVVSNRMDKTVVVEITTRYRHPKYHKIITKSTKIMAHSDTKIPEGKMVTIESTKKLSKNKSFKVIE